MILSLFNSPSQTLESSCNPIVTKPKPKVEPPKDEGAKAEETTAEEGGEKTETAAAATTAATGEEGSKMDEDQPTTAPATDLPEDMDLD